MTSPQVVALRTRLKPGSEKDYERLHAVIPNVLDAALRAGGVRSWRIWRDGLDLFHVIEVDDFTAMEAYVHAQPIHAEWSVSTNSLLDLEASGHGPLTLVWQLP